MNHRPLRVGSVIQAELNTLISREVEHEPGTLITITDVLVDKALEHARIEVSVMPPEKGPEAMRRLVAAQGKLQHLLMKKLNIKPFPRIEFVHDDGAENAAQVEKLLIEEKRE